MKKVRVDLVMDESLYEWVREMAHKYKISMAEFIRRALFVAKIEEESGNERVG